MSSFKMVVDKNDDNAAGINRYFFRCNFLMLWFPERIALSGAHMVDMYGSTSPSIPVRDFLKKKIFVHNVTYNFLSVHVINMTIVHFIY